MTHIRNFFFFIIMCVEYRRWRQWFLLESRKLLTVQRTDPCNLHECLLTTGGDRVTRRNEGETIRESKIARVSRLVTSACTATGSRGIPGKKDAELFWKEEETFVSGKATRREGGTRRVNRGPLYGEPVVVPHLLLLRSGVSRRPRPRQPELVLWVLCRVEVVFVYAFYTVRIYVLRSYLSTWISRDGITKIL